MRKLLLACILFLLPAPAFAQQGNTLTIGFAGVPTGTCSFLMFAVNESNGNLYDCQAGSWNLVTSSGGSTAWASLTAGTNSNLGTFAATGNTWDFSGSTLFKTPWLASGTIPGTSGQLLYNNSGVIGAEDPIVSGPDARGAAQSKNPVAGLGGIDYSSSCAGGPCVQEAKVDSSGNLYIGNFPATQTISGTVTANQGGAPWTVKPDGTVWTLTGTSANVDVTNTVPVSQSGTWIVQPGNTANTTPWLVSLSGTNSNVGVTQVTSPWVVGQASGANLHVNVDNFPATQTVAVASLPTGQQSMANSTPVVIAYNQTPIQVTQTTPTQIGNTALNPVPVKVQNPSGLTLYALINGVLTPVQIFQGQQTATQSVPVVIASNQPSIPVASTGYGNGPNGAQQVSTDSNGNLTVRVVGSALANGLPLPPCNAILKTNCQHF